MKKYMMIFMVLGFSIIKVNAQTEQANNSANVVTADTNVVEYIVELNDKSTITGKKVSDDGREIGILTADKGLILIPKYQIKSISSVAMMPVLAGKRIFPNPHPSRYYYSPSGIPMKKGEGYIQAIYYLAFQAQYALNDHWSIGAAAPIWAAPFLVNVKYTNTLSESADGKQNVYLATGVQAGSLSYIDPGTWLGVGYVGLTFGNPESNVTINGGVLGLSQKYTRYYYDPVTFDYTYTYTRENEVRPAISLSFNQRVSSSASLMGEVWYVGDLIVGGPGMRFYAGRKSAIDVAVLGAYDVYWGEGIFGIPFVSWTRKFGK
jgi:hypothetical protein